MDQHQGLRMQAAERWFWLWDTYIAAVCAVSLAVTLDEGDSTLVRRLGAAGSLTCIGLWYALFGRRLIRSGNEGRPAFGFVAGVLVLYGAELAFVPGNSLILFALYSMIFMAIPLRAALACVVLGSLVQPASLVLQGHTAELRHELFIPLVGMMVAVLMGTFIDRMMKESEQRASLIERLEASRAEVARLSHEAGTAAERARLAREIHDTLAQGFTSIVTLTQAAESELDGDRAKVRRLLALALRTARENLDEARALVAALTPSALDTGSLDDALRRQVERLGEETGIDARYRTVGPVGELPTVVEVVLLRAVQEALSNVRKHAGAGTVTVVLRFTPDSVAVSVVDDGVGFAGAGAGFGLAGMRARVEQVSGTLVVHSVPGNGTRLELEVPR